MSQKYVELPGLGTVLLAKRRGSRSLRLSIRPDSTIRVGMPVWAPYSVGIKFAQDRAEWIKSHLQDNYRQKLSHGDRIGKSYRLDISHDSSLDKAATRVAAGKIMVRSPFPLNHEHTQSAALKAGERALKADAQRLLKIRLDSLASEHGYKFFGFKIKKLRSRWGSCSNRGEITLNSYLIQLPWHLIDYVLVHELVHTKHMNHSKTFWESMEKALPNVKTLRREIRAFRPDIIAQ